MNSVFLIEDHDEALKVWRKAGIRQATLLHFDAHLDYAMPAAEEPVLLLQQARSVRELKEKLEASQLFLRYESNFAKQTNIGNFIYPAMREGIVRDFWWIVPGNAQEFKQSLPIIKKIFRNFFSGRRLVFNITGGIVNVHIGEEVICVCCFDSLPSLRSDNLLLDIDADYLVIDSIRRANNTQCIGKRKLWVDPQAFVPKLSERVPFWKLATISYSANGGFTPLVYKYCADEIASYLSPRDMTSRYLKSLRASKNFCAYRASGIPAYYRAALRFDKTYRVWDNNYGPLYLRKNDFSRAAAEFQLIRKVDPKHPGALCGLAQIALRKNRLDEAVRYAQLALQNATGKFFKAYQAEILFVLAMAAWKNKQYAWGEVFIRKCVARDRLNPQYYYWAGLFLEKQGLYAKAAVAFQDVVRLGGFPLVALQHLVKISCRLEENSDIIRFVEDKLVMLQKQGLSQKQRGQIQRIKQKLCNPYLAGRQMNAR